MSDETYNGWANRETWAANLWITNDEELYNYARETIADAIAEAGEDAGPFTGANALEEWFGKGTLEEMMTDEPYRIMRDDIGSLWRVDWQEIANGLTED